MDLPILGATGPSGSNGGASLAAIDRKYAVEIITADGKEHLYVFQMGRPVDEHGRPDLGALARFNPPIDAVKAVVEQLGGAWYGNPKTNPLVAQMADGGFIVWRHVTSFRYIGAVDSADHRAYLEAA